jgi:hypothetical protein
MSASHDLHDIERSMCTPSIKWGRTHRLGRNICSVWKLKQTNIPLPSSSDFFALCLPLRSLETQQGHHNRRSRHQLHCRLLRTSCLAYRPPLCLIRAANHVRQHPLQHAGDAPGFRPGLRFRPMGRSGPAGLQLSWQSWLERLDRLDRRTT